MVKDPACQRRRLRRLRFHPRVGKTPPPPGGGRGNPLQCSCRRIPWTGAWQATVLRVTKSQRQLEGLSMRVKKHHFEIPLWGKHSRPRGMLTSLGVRRLPVQPFTLQARRLRGGPAPRHPGSLLQSLCCSQLRSLPSWSPFTYSACSLDSAGQEAKTSPAPACSLPPCPPPQSQPGHGTGLGPDLLAIRTTEQEGGPEREGPGSAQHSGQPRPPGSVALGRPPGPSWAEGGHRGGRVRPSLDPLKPGAGTGFFSCRPLQGQHHPAVPLDFPPPQGAQFTLSFIPSTEL